MIRNIKKVFLIFSCLIFLVGCWDYKNMDEINIVSGIAIDKNPENNNYDLTIEVIDIYSMSEGIQQKCIYIKCSGMTIFQALNDCEKKIYNNLYYGGMRAIIISEEIAQKEGILNIIESFLRKEDIRETISITISQEETASDILTAKGIDSNNISYKIDKLVEENEKSAIVSNRSTLYDTFNSIVNEKKEVYLPAFHLTKYDNDGEEEDVIELNGLALFKKDKLIGYLDQKETLYFNIMGSNNVTGSISLYSNDPEIESLSFEIYDCRNNKKITFENGKLNVKVDIKVQMKISEIIGKFDKISVETIDSMKEETALFIENRIYDVLSKVQKEYKVDSFGFQDHFYKKHYYIWKTIDQDWEQILQDANIDINVDVKITGSGFIT